MNYPTEGYRRNRPERVKPQAVNVLSEVIRQTELAREHRKGAAALNALQSRARTVELERLRRLDRKLTLRDLRKANLSELRKGAVAQRAAAIAMSGMRTAARVFYPKIIGAQFSFSCTPNSSYDGTMFVNRAPVGFCIDGQAEVPPGIVSPCQATGYWRQQSQFPMRSAILQRWVPTGTCAADFAKLPTGYRPGGWRNWDPNGKALRGVNDKTQRVGAPSTVGDPRFTPGKMTSVQGQPMFQRLPWSVYRAQNINDPLRAERERTNAGYGTNAATSKGPAATTETEPTGLPTAPSIRPTRGQRERKVLTPSWIIKAVGLATEGIELVTAVYKCVPKKIRAHEVAKRRGKQPSLQDKAELIYKHFWKLPVDCVVFNVIMDSIEDSLYGNISKHSKNPYSRSPAGGRGLEFSRQGDAELPHGQLPFNEVQEWLRKALNVTEA